MARAPQSLDCRFVEIGDLPLYNEDLDSKPLESKLARSSPPELKPPPSADCANAVNNEEAPPAWLTKLFATSPNAPVALESNENAPVASVSKADCSLFRSMLNVPLPASSDGW